MMGQRVSAWLHRVSTGWVTLLALIVFVLFMALVLPRQSTRAGMDTGDVGSPDTSLWYAPRDLYRMAGAYGLEGRRAYVRARFTFDLVWPLVYAAFLGTAISWLSRRAFPASSTWQRANLAPLLALLLDYGENIFTSVVMLRYPARTPLIDWAAPVLTLAKWAFVGGSFVLLTIVAGAVAWRRLASHRIDAQKGS
jgi:hypothetical protein